MSLRSLLLIAAAGILIVATVFFARDWLEDQRKRFASQAPAPVAEVEAAEVLVAAEELPVGIFLKQNQLRWQRWPDDNLPPSYLVKGQVDEKELVGTVVRRNFSAGQPITMDRIIKPGDRGFLAAVLQAGYRALSIPVSAASGIAGLIFPGDRVDIILTHTLLEEGEEEGEGQDNQRRASETVLTNVRVLALDQKISDENGEPLLAKTATMEVTPKQAEILALVRELGSLSLSLRSLAKDEEELQRLANGEEPLEEPKPEKGRTYTWDSEASQLVTARGTEDTGVVVVARGKELTELKFKRGN